MGPLKNMVGTKVISDGRDLINLLVIFRGIGSGKFLSYVLNSCTLRKHLTIDAHI